MSIRRVNEIGFGLLIVVGLVGLVYQAELGKPFGYWEGALLTILPLIAGIWIIALAWAALRTGSLSKRLHKARGVHVGR